MCQAVSEYDLAQFRISWGGLETKDVFDAEKLATSDKRKGTWKGDIFATKSNAKRKTKYMRWNYHMVSSRLLKSNVHGFNLL